MSVTRWLHRWLESKSAGNIFRTRILLTAGSLDTGKDEVPFSARAVFAGFTGSCEVVAATEPCEVILFTEGWGMVDVFGSVFIAGFVTSGSGADARITEWTEA